MCVSCGCRVFLCVQLHTLEPKDVTTGTLITVTGRWHQKPFNFDEVKAPSQEVCAARTCYGHVMYHICSTCMRPCFTCGTVKGRAARARLSEEFFEGTKNATRLLLRCP